jgi:HTH-type transcriptional regulator/antitoxin HigA
VVEELITLTWLRWVSEKASAVRLPARFSNDKLSDEAISQLVQLSKRRDGPRAALEYVSNLGVTVIVESSLPGMRTDGAAFIADGVGPVIGLTLRYDRLDSFWFTLLHEIGHIVLHLIKSPDSVFIDSFDEDGVDDIEIEAEANAFAKDAFIPRDVWLRSEAFRSGKEPAVRALASKCSIHPAIVAGRLRFEKRKYFALSELLGEGTVRSELIAR